MILQESLGWPNPPQHNSRCHHLSVISCSGHWCLSDRERLRMQATSWEEWKLSTCLWSVSTELCERGVRFVGLCPIRLALKCTDWKYWTDTSLKPDTIFARFFSKHFQDSGFWLSSSFPRKKTSLLLPLLKVVGWKRYPIFRTVVATVLRECEFRLDDLDCEIPHIGRQTGTDRWQPSGQ